MGLRDIGIDSRAGFICGALQTGFEGMVAALWCTHIPFVSNDRNAVLAEAATRCRCACEGLLGPLEKSVCQQMVTSKVITFQELRFRTPQREVVCRGVDPFNQDSGK